jgi:hypothetical protein
MKGQRPGLRKISHVTHEPLELRITHVYIVNRSHVKISHSHVARRTRTDDPAFVKRNSAS